MLESPATAIVGVQDPAVSAGFWRALGFEPARETAVDEAAARALYGLDGPTTEVELRAAGHARGAIRLVAAPGPVRDPGPFDRGAYDISLYAADLEAAGRLAAEAGARVGPSAVLDLGPLVLHQRQAIGPDGVRIVFIASENRRSSVLDADPDRLLSEVHSVVWCVEDVAAAAAFWTKAGLVQAFEFPIEHTAVSTFLELPRADVPIRMALLSDPSVAPIRFELLAFPADPGPPPPDGPIGPGIFAIGFEVARVGDVALLGAERLGTPAEVDGRGAIAGTAPGGVRFELRARERRPLFAPSHTR